MGFFFVFFLRGKDAGKRIHCFKCAVYEGAAKELREVSRRQKDIQVCSSGERSRVEMKTWASASEITQNEESQLHAEL